MTNIYVPKQIRKPIEDLLQVFAEDWHKDIEDSFGPDGDSWISTPFLHDDCRSKDPFVMRVRVKLPSVIDDNGKGSSSFYSGDQSFKDNVIQILEEDPAGCSEKARLMSSALREFADEIDAMLDKGACE